MSGLQYTEGLKTKDVQVWNNAAFDNGESEDSSAIRPCWSPLKPIFINTFESFESFSSKENQIPFLERANSSVSSNTTPGPLKQVNSNGVVGISRIKSIKDDSEQDFGERGGLECVVAQDEEGIDKEIEEIEKEISRLSSRLEALRFEKAKKIVKSVEKRGRIVPAKFMEPKQSGKNTEEKKIIEENLPMSAKSKVNRRGLSLGPAEIVAGSRRGMSLGPSEIVSGVKSRQFRKQDMLTPVQPMQSRRKSCFWKLQDIDEKRVNKERGKSLSPSPKLRKATAKNQVMRQALTTIGSKKAVKKDDVILNSVQPMKLFKDGEKSVTASNKKPLKQGRVVPSRYNQSANQASAMRNRSLLENDKDMDESKNRDAKRSLSAGKMRVPVTENKNAETVSRGKKRWEIPDEIIVHGNYEDQKSPQSVSAMHNLLPRVRIVRCTKETPRDSGPAKRVAELVGRKSFFSSDEEVEPAVCLALSFAEEEETEER